MSYIPDITIQLLGMLIISIIVVYLSHKVPEDIIDLPTISNEKEQEIYNQVIKDEYLNAVLENGNKKTSPP